MESTNQHVVQVVEFVFVVEGVAGTGKRSTP
jgi:hypothetical protein